MLEIEDIIKILKREDGPKDLEKKSILLAGLILEMVREVPVGKGKKKAKEILDSGAAFAKFKEIIEAQKGSLSRLRKAPIQHIIRSQRAGRVTEIHNRLINTLGRILGSPIDKAAGLYLHIHRDTNVSKGDPLVTFHTESSVKLKEALLFYKNNPPISVK